MDLAWSTQRPTFPGLYWRRDGRKAAPYLILVFVGAQGLMMRVVEASHASVSIWNDGRPIDRPLDWLNYGEWAGPLGLRREEHIQLTDVSQEPSPRHMPAGTRSGHAQKETKMERERHFNMIENNATMIGCPACAGVLQMQSNRHGHQQFVCSVGHAFTLGTLYQAKEEESKRAQWSATVLMEHLVMILQMFQHPALIASSIPEYQIERRLQQLERHIAAIRAILEDTNVLQTEDAP